MAIKFIMPTVLMIIKHDQVFVKHVLGDTVSDMDISHATAILLHNDNCKSQHKSAKHFHHVQMLANEKEKPVLRVWSIVGMEKGKLTTLVVWLESPSRELHLMIIFFMKALGLFIYLINLLGKHTILLKLILKHWQNQAVVG